ncbi:unnamed protein product [Linum trigynum]|uniref:Uncharacterized protein n=1 Tax=Linum trigynum TaxID=586398 RepID=A0AAV2CBR1_9ROSI
MLIAHEPIAYLTLPVAFLLPGLCTFHFLLTRRFLPRTIMLDRVTPLDLWVLTHAVHNVPLDYCHFLFGHLYPFQQFEYLGHLPFGPLITRRIIRLEISIDPFRVITPNIYLTADDILDEIAIVVEGEDDTDDDTEDDTENSDDEGPVEDLADNPGDEEENPSGEPKGDESGIIVHWISSDDSENDDSDDPPLATVLADLRDAYNSD